MLLGDPDTFFSGFPSGEGPIRGGGFRIVTSFGCRDVSLGTFNMVLSTE